MFLSKLKLGTAAVLGAALFVAIISGSFTSLSIAQDAGPKPVYFDSIIATDGPAKDESDADFIRLDGSRNRVATIPAASEQEKQRQNARYAHRVGMNSRARIISRLLVFPNERRIHAFCPFDVSAPSRTIFRIPVYPSFGIIRSSSIFAGFMID